VEVAPWRLALGVVMPYLEGLTDRQAADAVRRGMEWQYALSLDLGAPGFDFTRLPDFRQRLLTHAAAQRLLDTCLRTGNARGGLNARGTQRTDSTHVLAAVRTLHRVACVLEAMPAALTPRSAAEPAWVQPHVPLDCYPRDGLRSDQTRLPQDARTREAPARQVGADGDQLLAWVPTADTSPGLRELPALEALRQIWLHPYDRGPVPGLEALRWRLGDAQPPAAVRITSPYDLEARYGSKRDTHGVGDTLHLTETCEPGQPALMTQVLTTPATTPDGPRGPAVAHDLAARDLLPGTPRLDSGSVDADFLVTAQRQHQIDGVGPPCGSSSWHQKIEPGDDWQALIIQWNTHQAPGPQGQSRVQWTPGRDVSGDPVLRLRFDRATGHACPTRQVCTPAKDAPRQLTVRPPAPHEAIQAARLRQETPEFKAQEA
jgi:transposase